MDESGNMLVNSTKWRLLRKATRTATVIAVALTAAVAVVVGFTGTSSLALAAASPRQVTHAAPAQIRPYNLKLTASELSKWRKETATAAQRLALIDTLRRSFAGVARVGVGTTPSKIDRTGGRAVSPDLSYGRTGDHFWIIASYADVADGAIWSGVAACAASAPEFAEVCETAGELLSEWASGWGRASNHGVWAAIYWWPPHVTGGRW